jgi:hypothetical protein
MMSKMSELHASLANVQSIMDAIDFPVSEVARREREGDYWVALMNIAFHPAYEEHPLTIIARNVLENHNGTENA